MVQHHEALNQPTTPPARQGAPAPPKQPPPHTRARLTSSSPPSETPAAVFSVGMCTNQVGMDSALGPGRRPANLFGLGWRMYVDMDAWVSSEREAFLGLLAHYRGRYHRRLFGCSLVWRGGTHRHATYQDFTQLCIPYEPHYSVLFVSVRIYGHTPCLRSLPPPLWLTDRPVNAPSG